MRHRPLDVLIALIAQKVQKVQKEESKTAFLFLIFSFSVLTTSVSHNRKNSFCQIRFAIIHDLFGTSDKQHTTLGQ